MNATISVSSTDLKPTTPTFLDRLKAYASRWLSDHRKAREAVELRELNRRFDVTERGGSLFITLDDTAILMVDDNSKPIEAILDELEMSRKSARNYYQAKHKLQ